jgi:hypothetical protein
MTLKNTMKNNLKYNDKMIIKIMNNNHKIIIIIKIMYNNHKIIINNEKESSSIHRATLASFFIIF